MNRGQMRLEVRRALNELTAKFFSDREINDWLNEACKVITSNAQQLQSAYQFNPKLRPGSSTEYSQEYLLPADCDEVFGVQYYSSSTYNLKKLDNFKAQTGQRIQSQSTHFWVKTYTAKQIDQVSTGIYLADIKPEDPNAKYTVLGLYPTPNNATDQITVHYYARHFEMLNDSDVPGLPPELRRGPVYYAAAIGAEKDQNYQVSDRFMQKYSEYARKAKDKAIASGMQMDFPTVQDPEENESDFGLFNVHWADSS